MKLPLYQDPDPDPVQEGLATTFADPGDQRRYYAAKAAGKSERQALSVGDPGLGTPSLGDINTANTFGVAVPTDYLRKNFGPDQADWRKARAQLTIGDKSVVVPLVDVGPGHKQQRRGVVVDVTDPLSKAFGGFDIAKAQIELLPNHGADYSTDKDAFYQEQEQIRQSLGAQPIGATPAPTPSMAQGTFPALSGTEEKTAQASENTQSPEEDMKSVIAWLSTATI